MELSQRQHQNSDGGARRRRLVFISFADLGGLSGPAIHVLNLVQHLARRDIDVTLISPTPSRPPPFEPQGVRQVLLAQKRRTGRPAIGLMPDAMRAVRGLGPADAIYVRAGVGTWPLVHRLRQQSAVPVTVEYNAWFGADVAALGYPFPIGPLATWMQVREAKQADGVRVVTRALKSLLVARGVGADKVRVVDNGTDLETFRPLSREACRRLHGLDAARPYLAFVGNLWPVVDFKTMLMATKLVRDANPDAQLLVVGDGPARNTFEALGRDIFGGDNGVVWLGARAPAAANEIMNAADVVLAPFTIARNAITGLAPLKIRDCAAAGRPCVASRIAGIDELAGEPWMTLAAPEDAHSFAAAIGSALARDATAISAAGRHYAERHFDWSIIARDVADLSFRPRRLQ